MGLHDQFINSYATDAVALQHAHNPQLPWFCDSSTGLLLHKGLVYVPENLRMNVLKEHHDAPMAGHPGIGKTIELLMRNYWFPGINSYVKDYVNSCQLCQ